MSDYRRVRLVGGMYFFTVVTHGRAPILTQPGMPDLLLELFEDAKALMTYENVAHVILPDHLHCVWQLSDLSADYSRLWAFIKLRFTKSVSARPEIQAVLRPVSNSKASRGDSAIWQRRFWEHTIRDQEDLNAHIDYIHFNPVKHGLVASPFEWRYSSIHRYLGNGFYEPDWTGRKEWPEGIGVE